jgi:hypothetical protein
VVPARDNVLYIGDEPPPRDIVFGPVRQRKPNPHLKPKLQTLVPVAQPPRPVRPTIPSGPPITEQAASWWRNSTFGTGLKVGLVVLVVAGALINPWLLIPLGIGAVVLYTIYAGVWLISSSMTVQPEPTPGIRFRTWQEMVRENLRAKSVGNRIGELTGGWLAAAILSGLLSVAFIAGADSFHTDVTTLSLYTWMAISATFGSWAVLTVGKFCEGIESDAWRRRIVMLALGLVAGLGAWALGDQVLVMDIQKIPNTWETPTSSLADIDPEMLTRFLVFFGLVFAVPGWWKQTDPLRKSRVSLPALGWCVLWSGIVSCFWPFPQPWGLMLAATISLSTQLAAPWMTYAERDAAKKEFRRA